MAIQKTPSYRYVMLICLMIILLISTGCQQNLSRPPLPAKEIITIADEFDRLAKIYMQAMNSHDVTLSRSLFTDDIAYFESTTSPELVGLEKFITLIQGVLQGHPNIEYRPIEKFVDRSGGYYIWEMRDFCDKACLEAEMYTIRQGKISEYWFLKNQNNFNPSVYTASLQNYANAWSSGKPKAVASLYGPDIVRQDTLFGENQQGVAAVEEFAKKYFSWYPKVSFELGDAYEIIGGLPLRTAGVFTIHVKDEVGQPCEIQAIIQLDTDQLNEQIVTERLFYNVDSLIACGWAQ